MAEIKEIEGIGPAVAEKLASVGITTVESLLAKCGSASGRSDVAAKTGVSEQNLLKWANHADLFRVKGIGSEYADLLEAAGVDSATELAQRLPVNLLQKLEAVNAEKKLVRRTPTESDVKNWVEHAKNLPKVVTH